MHVGEAEVAPGYFPDVTAGVSQGDFALTCFEDTHVVTADETDGFVHCRSSYVVGVGCVHIQCLSGVGVDKAEGVQCCSGHAVA